MPTKGRTADGGEYRPIFTMLLAACAIMPLSFAVKLAIAPEPLFPDFFGLWSYGRYVLTHPPATIYDGPALHAFQIGLGMPDLENSFKYPPWILWLLAPFGALPYAVAYAAWAALTFAAYAVALAVWRWPRPMAALLLLAPSSAVCLLVGQTGFVIAALMLGGMRLLPTRPLAAGALLAAVACKPQFALLVPFVLLFGRHWRALAGAALATVVLSLATVLAFGLDWGTWLASMHDRAGPLIAGRETLRDMMPTVTSAVLLPGGSVTAAHLAQAAGALAGVLALWRVRGRHDPEAQAVLPLATMLATPYAFHYDLPVVTGAVLAVIAARVAAAGRFGQAEFPLLLACVVAPVIPIARIGEAIPLVPVVFAATLWLMARPRDRLTAGQT